MKIAISSTKEPKINGVKEALEKSPYFKEGFEHIEFIPFKIDSGVSDMPMTMEETMAGAKGRVDNLKKEINADYYFGIEGGVMQELGNGYLGGIVYIENKFGEGHYGFSPFIEVPSAIMSRLKAGEDLGPLMSELSGITKINHGQGSMGAWSDGMFIRQDEFREASKAAISPFFNKFYQI